MAKALHASNAHRPEDIAYAGNSATKRFNCRHRKRSHGHAAGGQLLVCGGAHFKMGRQNFQIPGGAARDPGPINAVGPVVQVKMHRLML